MKTGLLITISVIIVFALVSFAMPNLSKVYGSCEMTQSDTIQPSIGYQWTKGLLYIDNADCTWKLFGTIPIASLLSEETSFQSFSIVQYAYAGCAATIIPQPCFDSYSGSTEPMTKESIMKSFARYLDGNYPDWQMSDRKWDDFDKKLNLPAIICTEYVFDGMTHYMMAKWIDTFRISSFENHRNDWMCNIWLPPLEDGVKIRWDKSSYLPNDVGVVMVTADEMNQDDAKLDSFVIHVWSDTDHTGLQTTVTETDVDTGIFDKTIFFTPEGKSNGTGLLVEDAVYAEYKFSIGSARIINESRDVVLEESNIDNFQDTKNPNECWYQDDDGNMVPCTIDSVGPIMIVGMFLVVFWPYVVFGIVIVIIIIIWGKKRK